MKYAKIIVNNKTQSTDELYTYKIHGFDVEIGARVIVPFGNGQRNIEGYVADLSDDTPLKESRIKSILAVVDDEIKLTKKDIELSIWMRNKYLCKYIDAVLSFVPTGAELKKYKTVKLGLSYFGYNKDSNEGKIIEYLQQNGEVPYKKIVNYIGKDNTKLIDALEKNGIIIIKETLKSDVKIKYERIVAIKNREEVEAYIEKIKNAPKQKSALETLLGISKASTADLREKYGIDLSVLKVLEKKNLIEIFLEEDSRVDSSEIVPETKVIDSLTEEQEDAIYRIGPSIKNEKHESFLIHGVTGSGKTEIYMQLIKKVLAKNKRVIMMVPEISLTYQLTQRFIGRFGRDNVAIIHSRISKEKRYDEWLRIKRGKAKIIIGARSAIFSPIDNLGAIIIDEEHESSYKSDKNPRYNAIELAEKRAEINDAILVLGSATPTTVTNYNSEIGKYKKLTLNKRYNENPLPEVKIIDMREELKNGNRTMFSKKLHDGIVSNLEKGKQIILFLNRRGFSTFVSCRSCGYVVKCDDCGISMTYHQNKEKVICHYCGLSKEVPTVCPECESKYIKFFGVGTEQLEQYTKKMFPDVKIKRLDFDTSRKKGSMESILSSFNSGETQILIGTQIVAKGLDFPNVGLVGIIAADSSLNIPDFRSRERTFQLISQAAGRAGRGDELGEVVVQTYAPDHFSVISAAKHNYNMFYKNEIILRKQLEYPPFSDIIQFIVSGMDNEKTYGIAKKIADKCTDALGENYKRKILGPQPAPRLKINDKYRFQILLKINNVDKDQFKGIINDIKANMDKLSSDKYHLSVDVNPFSFI